jgi:thymidylate kinase
LVGLAGAGKTTLAEALTRRDPSMRPGPSIQRSRHLYRLVTSGILLVPSMLRLYAMQRLWLPFESREMICLDTLHQLVTRESFRGAKMLVLDQGPVYALTYLHWRGHHAIKSRCFKRWWHRSFTKWAITLDAIVWLDAPDSVLIQRIREREKPHEVKEWTDQAMLEFLHNYRSAFQQIISALTRLRRPKLLCFDTQREPLDQVFHQVEALVSQG